MIIQDTFLDNKIREKNGQTVDFSSLKQESIKRAYQIEDSVIVFECISGYVYILYHYQDCCESVYISDICGELNDLSGKTVRAEVATGEMEYGEWTFFKIDTINGCVTIRFNGESEYYSVGVDCIKLDFRKEILSEKINDF